MQKTKNNTEKITTHFHIITLFPDFIESYCQDAMLGKAIENKIISVSLYNPRDYTKDKHKKVDDKPYGGGPGMVMTAEPILLAFEQVKKSIEKRVKKASTGSATKSKIKVILTSPGGETFSNDYAQACVTKKYTDIVILCGRYEGIDSRVAKILKAESVSIGNYVLTGGELPALVMVDTIARRIPGVLGNIESLEELRTASHEMYTRPAELVWNKRKHKVPQVLQEGNHKEIEKWRSGK